MEIVKDLIMPLILALFAASGFWTLILYLIQRRDKNKDATTKLILGLGYRQITQMCIEYISRGSITKDEYEDLIKYLYTPYLQLGGDGTAEKLVDEVKKLPIKEI